jgi:5-methyltetrahydrofolate corrinoid/iron sulfur protein methyltransferase
MMELIGENVNVMVTKIGTAMKERDAKTIQDLAVAEAEAGMDYLDINLGPARKGGAELMGWMVKTIQEVVDLPLYLDTTNVEAIEAGLRVYENKRGKAVINSVMARPERMEAELPLAKKYDAGFVALLWGPEGMPRDEAERGVLATELMNKAAEYEIPNEDVWIDPIVTPVTSQQDQVKNMIEFMKMFRDLQEMAPGLKSTCGLSNVSNGAPKDLRPILNQTYLLILEKYGMASAIVDAFDEDLKTFARGERQDITNVVRGVVSGEEPDSASLSKEQVDYVKTAKILLGHSLYSDSWLQL